MRWPMSDRYPPGTRVRVRVVDDVRWADWPALAVDAIQVATNNDGGLGTVLPPDTEEHGLHLVAWDQQAELADDSDGDGMPLVTCWRIPGWALEAVPSV